MSIPLPSKIPLLLAAVICGVFLYLFTFPIMDGDCFWHLASGRWIAEHKTLPNSDFLSFTVTDHNPFRPESERIPFLLKQYWLGQLALFGTWHRFGSAGIVMLRAVIYTGILVGLFLWMRRHNKGILPLILTMLAGLLMRDIPNERPQLFTFVFTPLVLYLLEAGARPGRLRLPALAGLPLLMLLWCNTHGAYILGIGLIILAVAPDLTAAIVRKNPVDRAWVISAGSAILITLLNPNGFMAWREFFSTDRVYAAGVYENISPLVAAVRLHDWHAPYWCYLVICLTGIILCWRRMELKHLLTLMALSLLSLTALRYLIFPLLAAPLLVRYLPELSWRPRNTAALITVFVFWLACTWNNQLLKFTPGDRFPQAAAAFIRQQIPSPRAFNYYDWGGHISWYVPGAKTFIDGRGLVEEFSLLQDKTMKGESWRETFDRYGVNTVIIPGMSESLGTVYPLAEILVAANDWQLVFADEVAIVFVRDGAASERLTASQAGKALQLHLVKLSDRLISEHPDREAYWQTKANALQLLGDRQGAIKAYQRVLQINPANEWAKRMLAMGVN